MSRRFEHSGMVDIRAKGFKFGCHDDTITMNTSCVKSNFFSEMHTISARDRDPPRCPLNNTTRLYLTDSIVDIRTPLVPARMTTTASAHHDDDHPGSRLGMGAWRWTIAGLSWRPGRAPRVLYIRMHPPREGSISKTNP